MSLFKQYSPELLWTLSLRLVNAIFRNPPKMQVQPESYFKSVMHAHQVIRDDLTGTFDEVSSSDATTTIGQIFCSLQELDKLLFGLDVSSSFPNSIEGCCLYTDYLERRLKKSQHVCVLL